MSTVKIIGAGLAGSEAAWQCARRGVPVDLCEMRPVRSTPAHQTSDASSGDCDPTHHGGTETRSAGEMKIPRDIFLVVAFLGASVSPW